MSSEKSSNFSEQQSTPGPGVFPGADALSADSERLSRISEALLGPLPIEEAILALAESDGMTPKSALYQLSRWARGTMAPFLAAGPDGQLRLDLSTEEAHVNRDLLRRVVHTPTTTQTLLGTIEESIKKYSARLLLFPAAPDADCRRPRLPLRALGHGAEIQVPGAPAAVGAGRVFS